MRCSAYATHVIEKATRSWMPRQNKESGPFVALRMLTRTTHQLQEQCGRLCEMLYIICKVQLHTCYFSSKSNCTKVKGFARIYTHRAGRRTHRRRDREGKVQLEWAAQDFLVLGLGSEVLITDRDLCYTARGED